MTDRGAYDVPPELRARRDDPPIEAPADDTWWPIADPLAAAATPRPRPAILTSAGGAGLLYAGGVRHLIAGEPEAGKTWLAAAAAAEEITAGHSVLWWDADAMGVAALVERLRLLGTADADIGPRLLFLTPDRGFDPVAHVALADTIRAHSPSLAVIDALNPALVLCGLDPNSTSDVQTFWHTVVGIPHAAGVSTVLLDHVAKDKDTRGAWSFGSERKRSGTDVQINLAVDGAPLTRTGRKGRITLAVAKDRPGWHERGQGGRIGTFVLDLDARTPWRLELGHETSDQSFRPTALMEKVSRYLETADSPVSKKQIEAGVDGKNQYKRDAIDLLVDENFAARRPGRNGGHGYTSIRPFRQADDSRPRPDLVPARDADLTRPRPDLAPDENTSTTRDRGDLAPPRPASPLGAARDLAPDAAPLQGRPSGRGEVGDGPNGTHPAAPDDDPSAADWRAMVPPGTRMPATHGETS